MKYLESRYGYVRSKNKVPGTRYGVPDKLLLVKELGSHLRDLLILLDELDVLLLALLLQRCNPLLNIQNKFFFKPVLRIRSRVRKRSFRIRIARTRNENETKLF
jgi:hypothetical protein